MAGQQFGIPQHHPSLTDGPGNPLAGERGEVAGFGQRQSSQFGSLDDGSCQRMFAAAFQRRSQPEQFIARETVRRFDRNEPRFSFCESTRLIDDQCVGSLQCFESLRVPNQNAMLGSVT